MNLSGRLTASIGVFLVLCMSVEGQINNSVYFMQGIPQSNRVNPAFQPQSNFYLGFPALAPVRVELTSSSFSYKDIIYPHPTQDSLITFLHPDGDKEAFLNQLKNENYIYSDLRASLVSVGFRTKIGFFSLDLTTRNDEAISFPADLARLLMLGTVEGETYVLDGMGVDVSAFDEVSLGWSHAVLENLQVGARAKMLFGIGDLTTQRSEMSVTTSRDVWNIQSDLLVRASLPFAEVVYDDEGMIEDIILDEDIQNPRPFALPRYLFNFGNPGFSADVGISYRPLEQLQLSASAIDIGFISWKDQVHEATYKTAYDFQGFELDPFELSDEYTLGDYLDSAFSELSDSLLNFLTFTPGGTYSKRLNTKLYLGASFDVTPHINFGILSRTDFLRSHVDQQFTASANFSAGRILNLTLSYTYKNAYLKNLGAGFSLNLGPLNMYLVSDNALDVIFWPQEARSMNLWFGMNLVFGYKEFTGKLFKDKPLIY